MAQPKLEDISHEMQAQQQMQLVYARKTQERQLFLEDLYNYRKRKDILLLKEIKDSIGPKWYQALSVLQTAALDTLASCIYQDLLEARPVRTRGVIKTLGIIPRPSADDLMHCVYLGRNDPKEMLAQLFLLRYDQPFNLRRTKYDLNARLILTGIFYLGLPELQQKLHEMFQPDQPESLPKPDKKPKTGPPPESPYLQKMIAICYEPQRSVKKLPPPLPSLDAISEHIEDTPPVPKPPPPPPPPPPPKKRIPRSVCDKVAEVSTIDPYSSATSVIQRPGMTTKTNQAAKRVRRSKYVTEVKKKYGIGNTRVSSSGRRRKPKAPSTGIPNTQYMICGIAKVHGKPVYILGSVTVMPVDGDIIHGGHALVQGVNINIHRGIRGKPPPPRPDSCDCLKEWTDPIMKYLKKSKCYCGHHYDYYNEGVFPPEELPFFEKPTRHGPFQINHGNIYELDHKKIHISKEFKKIWETDSALHIDVEDPIKKKPQQKKNKRIHESSSNCIGPKAEPEEYLKYALHRMRNFNIAARLPDVHQVPEMVVWMRRRLHGAYSRKDKKLMAIKSNWYWTLFTRFAGRGIPHVPVPKVPEFTEPTTWKYKQKLNDKFRKFANKYRLEMFRAHADFSNMLWPSMFQAQMPDKKFREIYFSYLFGTVDNLTLMRPYSAMETQYKYAQCIKKPYRCPPKGIENLDV